MFLCMLRGALQAQIAQTDTLLVQVFEQPNGWYDQLDSLSAPALAWGALWPAATTRKLTPMQVYGAWLRSALPYVPPAGF